MGLITWIAIAVIALVVIGLGVGVFFSGLIRGAEIIGNNPAVQNITQEAKEFVNSNIQGSSISSRVLVITTNEARYRIGELVPGASKTLTWNQQDDNGNNVPTGDYTATVQTISSSSSQSVSAQVNFEITE